MTERPTPRTNAIEQKYKLAVAKFGGLVPYEAMEFARQLERELAEAREETLEQARLLGMSGQREARLLSGLAEAKGIARYWRDASECSCDSGKPIGACLKCDMAKIAG